MKILTVQEIDSISTRGKQTESIRKLLNEIQIGEGVHLTIDEWPIPAPPNAHIFNKQFKVKRFKVKNLKDRKEIVFIRVV